MSRQLKTDRFVVYRSPDEPDNFIAHSLETDQIGIGATVEDAVLDLILVLRGLFAHCAETKQSPLRRAPQSIHNHFKNADPLPENVWEEIKRRSKGDASADLHSSAKEATFFGRISEDTHYSHVLELEEEEIAG